MLGCEVSDPERRRRNELRAGKVAREDEAIGTHEPEVDRIGPAARCEVVTVAKGRKGWGAVVWSDGAVRARVGTKGPVWSILGRTAAPIALQTGQ